MNRDERRIETRSQYALYFASIASMQYHPGAGTKDHARLTLQECANIAEQMVDITKEKFQCRG